MNKRYLDIPRNLEIRRQDALNMLMVLKETNTNVYNSIETQIETVIDMVSNKFLYIDNIEEFKRANTNNLQKIIDDRTIEETVFNYYIGLIIEFIAINYLSSLGFKVRRSGVDKNIKTNEHTLRTTPDLEFFHKNKWNKLEVQFTNFSYKGIKIKKYKADINCKEDNSFMVISYNRETNEIEYITFKIREFIRNANLIKNDKNFGGKDTYLTPLNTFNIKKIS